MMQFGFVLEYILGSFKQAYKEAKIQNFKDITEAYMSFYKPITKSYLDLKSLAIKFGH